jgi:hypothetical protein
LDADQLEEGYGQEDVYEHKSYLGQLSASFSDFNSFLGLEIDKYDFSTNENADLYAHNLYQQGEFTNTVNYFSSYEPRADCVYEDDHEGHFSKDNLLCGRFSADHSRNPFNPTIEVSHDYFVEETIVAPKFLTVHTGNQQSLFVYDDLQDYMFSSFGQGFVLHDQRNFVAPDCHGKGLLLLKEQGGHLFLSKREFMQWQSFHLDQQVCDLGFEDPVALMLESYFLNSLKISDFIISLAFEGEYGFPKNLWLLLYLCCYPLISCRHVILSVVKLLSWLLWKFSFT